jgi:hypothetical protein
MGQSLYRDGFIIWLMARRCSVTFAGVAAIDFHIQKVKVS